MTDPSRTPSQGAFPAGWFPDPLGRYEHRWFNGSTWTSDVSTDGQRYVDPNGISAGHHPHRQQAAPDAVGNGSATAAMTCGIIGTLLAWLPFLVVAGAALGVLAVVFGVKGRRRARENGQGGTMALIGLVTGVIALLLCIVGVITTVVTWREVVGYAEPGPATVVVDDCTIDSRTATVTGTITNDSDTTRGYTIFVTVDGGRAPAVIDELAPDETAEWQAVVTDDVIVFSCEPTISLNGPYPFGIEMDPVDNISES